MSTLVLATVAGLALGNGPGPVPAEAEQGLDMRGAWEGTWLYPGPGPSAVGPLMQVVSAYFKDDAIHVGGRAKGVPFRIVDEGRGKCRVTVVGEPRPAVWLGIYRYKGDLLLLCLGSRGVRPLTFEPVHGEFLLTLRRVRPGK